MEAKNLSDLTDEELLQEAKKMKSNSLMNALFIGVLIGIIFYSVYSKGWGLFLLFPIFLIYKLVNKKSNYDSKEIERILKERNLK